MKIERLIRSAIVSREGEFTSADIVDTIRRTSMKHRARLYVAARVHSVVAKLRSAGVIVVTQQGYGSDGWIYSRPQMKEMQ